MAFFGFETSSLEDDKAKFLNGGGLNGGGGKIEEYTWGTDGYDGLGDALQEGGDELNDETFGAMEPVGKDFDFAGSTQSLNGISSQASQSHQEIQKQPEPPRAAGGIESLWGEKSPFSVLSRSNTGLSSSRSLGEQSLHSSSSQSARFAPFGNQPPLAPQPPVPRGGSQQAVRTLAEIEEEMRLNARQPQALAARLTPQLREASPQLYDHSPRLAQRVAHQVSQVQQIQQRGTPPPRMHPHAQSPRFHHHLQQEMLIEQQQLQIEEERHLLALQERLQAEELQRQARAQQLQQMMQQEQLRRLSPGYTRTAQDPYADELQAARRLQQMRISDEAQGLRASRSNGSIGNAAMLGALDDERVLLNGPANLRSLQQSIQRQQRLLSEAAQADFMRQQGFDQGAQDDIRQDALRRIVQAEQLEERRRRKLNKITHMSRYNDLMTQSDKDFITRIQVSQLVTQDPWAEDFYAQTYTAVMRNNMGLQGEERILNFGSGIGGVGLGFSQRPSGRKASAIQKMEAQVEKIVQAARLREKEKGSNALHNLQGALGKTAGRSYKAAPRQLLQVDEDAAHEERHRSVKEAARLGAESLGVTAEGFVQKDPLTRREALAILEELYDIMLQLEKLAREQPPQEEEEAYLEWEKQITDLRQELWLGLRVTVPLGTSVPHPFISLLHPAKGKKLLTRIARFLDTPQLHIVLTLIHACFGQLDVVANAPLLDSLEDTEERKDVERQTQAFMEYGMRIVIPPLNAAPLKLLHMLLSTMLERNDIIAIARSKPGISLLTLFMSRLENIKQSASTLAEEQPTAEEVQKWQHTFDVLFHRLMPEVLSFFPSSRIPNVPAATADTLDYPVWTFLASLAVHCSNEQQAALVRAVREKVLEAVTAATKGLIADEEARQLKLANVNLLLHALGLDSSQITAV
ncbi:hypothetical protein PUNSTDRAFT_54266 [Punctularia strigosozonata HHB-11173 SS5]|uniref:uncharacterized protein n=1 Tax=Punctularia strigosozonata (strain HHB-11173) TaxID=741275 RepID=UPI0004418659|nr:uncharacterized protein PUNSTDRAFT_54266 [Punctularia strigosozonata HHB-11173 SS5]EIN05954.1 hypothetical protein PUNSTDRAFT_54266 [Punctularia strigosozonata HHB-11173 SS5]